MVGLTGLISTSLNLEMESPNSTSVLTLKLCTVKDDGFTRFWSEHFVYWLSWLSPVGNE